jgi:malyl-CoA/(S)-citramalyl-CoA lyase
LRRLILNTLAESPFRGVARPILRGSWNGAMRFAYCAIQATSCDRLPAAPGARRVRRINCPIRRQLGPDVTLFAAWRPKSVQLAFALLANSGLFMKLPRQFFKPLAIGAPAPLRDLPVRLERMIHFVPPHLEKLRQKVPDLIRQVDVVLGNLEDAIPVDAKEAARRGFVEMGKAHDYGTTGLWTRVNALNSPWALDDIVEIVAAIGNKLDVIMLPKVEGAWDIHYLDQLLAQLEARHQVSRPILIHAILETAEGVNNVETIASASPRMHGISLGPADLAASRAMKTTRVGGGHPDYVVLADANSAPDGASDPGFTQGRHYTMRTSATADVRSRAAFQQDLWHYTIARMVDACAAAGIKPFYGPFGDFSDPAACEAQFRNSFLMGCAGAWSLHPTQIEIAKRVFSPDAAEVAFAKKILAAMPDGSGAVMIDGKMQDDATWKQARVVVDLARLVAAKDPAMAALYGL